MTDIGPIKVDQREGAIRKRPGARDARREATE